MRRALVLALVGASIASSTSGCDEQAAAPRPRGDRARPEASEPTDDRARVRGSFFSLALPADARETTPTQLEVVDRAYRLEDGAVLSVFRPMPGQTELDAWSDVVERLLDGIPARHEETELAGQPALVAELPGELRWMLVLDGRGVLVRCVAGDAEGASSMHARCDEVVETLAFVRPIE